MAYDIVVVDDEPANLESLERVLRSDGGRVIAFQDPRRALPHLRTSRVEVLMTDLRMGAMSGLELLEAAKALDPALEVIVITAYGTVELAVEAMKKGAYDFITKPLQRHQVLRAVHKALEKRGLVAENRSLREELQAQGGSPGRSIIGRSQAVRSMLEIADQAARSRATVLIEGESGTGKGVLAEYLHRNSDGAQGILVKINCTAIPENLLEAELFGYEPGAFTGATRTKKGRVELAHGGTLFLDEIGIAPPSLQAKLLRFLQDGEFERLGSNETRSVRTRVIGATNTDLKKAVASGAFREDLYYRLNVVHIRVPALRERADDIPLLAQRFLEESARKNARPVPRMDTEVAARLGEYVWPGNVRELENVMERLVVLNRTGIIRVADLPGEIHTEEAARSVLVPLGLPLRDVERLLMDEALRVTRGDKKLAARLLGVHPRTIYRYLEAISRETEGTPPTEPTVVPPAETTM